MIAFLFQIMWSVRVLLLLIVCAGSSAHSQQLIINEISQGPSGAREYVELVVAGTPGCQTPVPTQDLRGVILDDNNGIFQGGSGAGIAQGAIRFANVAFWQAIPQGTIIVVYNESERNTLLPADDASMSDGNHRLILPANSNLFEGTAASPSSGNSAYPTGASSWTTGAAQWSNLGMANSGDSFQTRASAGAASPTHAVSWGSNNQNNIVYFAGAAGGKVYSFTNTTGANPALVANWTSGSAPTAETPGAGNNAANTAWITAMQNGGSSNLQVTFQVTNETCVNACNGAVTAQPAGGTAPYSFAWTTPASTSATISNLCDGAYSVTVTDNSGCTTTGQTTVAPGAGLQVTFNSTNETCAGNCDGNSTASAAGGVQPYQFLWSNTIATAANPNLCPGTYTVGVMDQNGCTGTGSTTITAGTANADATITTTGPFTTLSTPVQMQSVTAGGTWLTADCGTCLTASGLFNPQAAGAGTFQICHTVGAGQCADNDCVSIIVTEGCTPQETQEIVHFCAEDSVFVYGNWENMADTYSQTFTDINGCDSTHNIVLITYELPDNQDALAVCPGDSVLVFGGWVKEPGIYSQEAQSADGCTYTEYVTVYTEQCTTEEFSLFIPNTFTPNGDHTNDLFTIQILGGMVEEGFIFNRWGEVITKFTADKLSWDGKTEGGNAVQDGVYTYLVFYSPAGGSREKVHGFVTVLK